MILGQIVWSLQTGTQQVAQVMIDTQHSIRIQLNNAQTRATVVEIREEGKWVNMQTKYGETFLMKREGRDITSGLPRPSNSFLVPISYLGESPIFFFNLRVFIKE